MAMTYQQMSELKMEQLTNLLDDNENKQLHLYNVYKKACEADLDMRELKDEEKLLRAAIRVKGRY